MEIQTARAEGLRDCRKLMLMAKAGKYNGYLLEGMACPGGCVAGAGTLLPVDLATKVIGRYQGETDRVSPMDSAYRDEGHKLD
jgi:iron only hydrogenase large subunit-like protein